MRWIVPFLLVIPMFLSTLNAMLNRWSRIDPHRTPFTAGRYTFIAFLPAFAVLQHFIGPSGAREVAAGLLFVTIYLGALVFLNWWIFTLTDVSMHIQLIMQIHRHGSATVAELQERYNKNVIVKNRIPRLLELGQLRLRDGKLVIAGRSVLFAAVVLGFLRKTLGIPARPDLAEQAMEAQPHVKPSGTLPTLEALALMAALIAIVALHWTNRSYAGALWRDEASVVALATMPSFSEIWGHFHLDSVPLVLVSLLRGLDALGLTNDGFLRAMGMLIGLGLAGLLILNGFRMKYSPPFVSLALIGLSPTIIRWGDEVRAYGLGTLFVLLTFGLVWRFATSPSRAGLLWAGVFALASVHTHYSNSVFIGAICTAGALVCAAQKKWRRAAAILGIGFIAAVSMLIYLGPIQREHAWYEVVLLPSLPIELLYSRFIHALSGSGQWMPEVWMTLYMASLLAMIVTITRSRILRATEAQRRLAIYALSVMVIASVGYAVFLKGLRYPSHDWYYVTVMALVATAMDAGLGVFGNFSAGRIVRAGFLVGVLALTFGNAQAALRVRLTNVDHIAAVVGSRASEKDFVLVNPHYVGVTFHRYFKGNVPWDTVPPLVDHRVHRFDQIKEMMTRVQPVLAIGPLIETLSATLRSGGRIWVVGSLHYLRMNEIPLRIGPAPNKIEGWTSFPYEEMWSQYIAFFLQTRTQQFQGMGEDVSVPEQVSEFENEGLAMFEGWQEPPPVEREKGPAVPG